MKTLPLLLSCLCLAATYREDFESAVKPTNWVEWNSLENHKETWNSGVSISPLGTNSIVFDFDSTNVALGAFCRWPFKTRDVTVEFRFEVNDFPGYTIIEVIDLYDGGMGNGDEVADIYLTIVGQLILSMGNAQNVATASSLPKGEPVKMWMHYRPSPTELAYGSIGWATYDVPLSEPVEPTSGPQFASSYGGTYHTAVDRHLFGPITQSGVIFWYDDVRVTAADVGVPPTNLVVITGTMQTNVMAWRGFRAAQTNLVFYIHAWQDGYMLNDLSAQFIWPVVTTTKTSSIKLLSDPTRFSSVTWSNQITGEVGNDGLSPVSQEYQ